MLKKIFKDFLNNCTMFSSDEIISKIRDYKVISFDVFDTATKRSVVNTSDVFTYAIYLYNKKNNTRIDEIHFKTNRQLAYKRALEKAALSGREEITLNEIYSYLEDQYSDSSGIMREEIIAEMILCHVNPIIKKVFDWCVTNNKRIFFISDMYLPQEVIEKLLWKCGYESYDELFVSSDCCLKKSSGNLYEFILNKKNLKRKDWVHIGDNYRSDYLMSKKFGISPILISPKLSKCKFYREIDRNEKVRVLESISCGYIDESWSVYYQYGFEVLGPLLFGFSKWLHSNASDKGLDRLLFLSRDGFLLKEAYNCLYQEEAFPNEYLYVSRNALTIPLIWKSSGIEELFKDSSRGKWDYKMFFARLGIDEVEGLQEWQRNGLSIKKRYTSDEIIKSDGVKAFFIKFEKKVKERSLRQYLNVREYLENSIRGKVGLVDIGWAGTIQKHINKIMDVIGTDYSTTGFYLSVNNKLYDDIDVEYFVPRDEKLFRYAGAFIEFPFTTKDGSTIGYGCIDNRAVPVLKENEYRISGNVNELQVIQEIQDGAMFFLDNIKHLRDVLDIDWIAAYHNLKYVCKYPRKIEVEMFGNFLFYNDSFIKLASPKSFSYYCFNPLQFIEDISSAGWRTGFLKRLLILPFPYADIMNFLQKKENSHVEFIPDCIKKVKE